MDEDPLTATVQNAAFIAVRDRAYELADTGRYRNWSHVAYTLLVERFAPDTIRRLNGDGLAVLMISRVCERKHVAAVAPMRWLRACIDKVREW